MQQMRTIPLQPVYNNQQFNELSPACQAFFIKALYLLSQEGRLNNLPKVLRGYFHCSNPSYYQFKPIYEAIMKKVVDDILEIKRPIDYRKQRQAIGQAKKRAINQAKNRENNAFSDENAHLRINAVLSSPEKSRYHQGMHDHVARKQAIENNEKGDEVWLSDN